jgi:5-formyltetrahydrofolate cyclo-ligase
MNPKQFLRRQAQLARQQLSTEEKDERSRRIVGRVLALPQYAAANTVLWYLGVRNEVLTENSVIGELSAGQKRVAIPWCEGESLLLFHLREMSELVGGAFGILEPKSELRQLASQRVAPAEVDVALVPGVAFDRQGNRLGHGAGYYDRLLAELPPSACLIGLAYECQLVEAISHEPHDVGMDLVVTEADLYLGHRTNLRPRPAVE